MRLPFSVAVAAQLYATVSSGRNRVAKYRRMSSRAMNTMEPTPTVAEPRPNVDHFFSHSPGLYLDEPRDQASHSAQDAPAPCKAMPTRTQSS